MKPELCPTAFEIPGTPSQQRLSRWDFLISLLALVILVQGHATAASAQIEPSAAGALRAHEGPRSEATQSFVVELPPREIPADSAAAVVSIPVLGNALGDVVQDSLLNLRDLLRLRDIVVGAPPPVSPYEVSEGDIDGNGSISVEDVRLLMDVLLLRQPVPQSVGAEGGRIVGNGGRTAIDIPPGAFDGSRVLTLSDISEAEFFQSLRVDSLNVPGLEFLAGARLRMLNPTPADTVLPPGLSLSEEISPLVVVDTSSNSALYALLPDLDGNGIPEFSRMGDLELRYADSTDQSLGAQRFMVFDPPEATLLTGYDVVDFDWQTHSELVIPAAPMESGKEMVLWGSRWHSVFEYDYQVGIVFDATPTETSFVRILTFVSNNLRTYSETRGVLLTIPYVDNTSTARLFVRSLLNNLDSNTLQLTLLPPAAAPEPGLKDSLIAIYSMMDTIIAAVADDSIPQAIASGNERDLSLLLPAFRSGLDSLRSVPEGQIDPNSLAQAVAYFKNGSLEELFPGFLELLNPTGSPSQDGKLDLASDLINRLGCVGIDPNALLCQSNCILRAVGAKVVLSFLCATAAGLPCQALPGGIVWYPVRKACECGLDHLLCSDLGRYLDLYEDKCKECCCGGDFEKLFRHPVLGGVNFPWKDAGIEFECIHQPWPAKIGDMHRREEDAPCLTRQMPPVENPPLSTEGFIVSVQGSPLPGLSQGIVGPTGRVMIPVNVSSGTVTLSAYDPVTGFFDPDIAQVTVGDPFDERHFFFGSFLPDTSVIREPLALGSWTADSVTTGRPRHEYLLYIAPEMVGYSVEIGFRAAELLTFVLKNPSGGFIVQESATKCVNVRNYEVAESGQYVMTVTYGQAGGDGAFAVGSNASPSPATPYLCGGLADSLYAGVFDYIVADPAAVPNGATCSIQPGVIIGFEADGSITASGVLSGVATPAEPIILKPREASGADGPVSMRRSDEGSWTATARLQR